MIETTETKGMTRRSIFSMLGLAALAMAVPPTVLLTTSDAEAESSTPASTTPTGTERRQERRSGRTERRQARRSARTERRTERRSSRTERREHRRGQTSTPKTSTPQ
jgi:polynucleotide 5'-kinase involved in rRNA processing